jgi:hypothetical protein
VLAASDGDDRGTRECEVGGDDPTDRPGPNPGNADGVDPAAGRGPTAAGRGPLVRVGPVHVGLAVAVAAVSLVAAVLRQWQRFSEYAWIDLRVYRSGALEWAATGTPYTTFHTEGDLLYTYPPSGLLALAPLAWGMVPLSAWP